MAPSTKMTSPSSLRAMQAPPCTMWPQRSVSRSPCARASASEALTEQGVDQLGVGAPAGRLHHRADEPAQRLLLAAAEVGGGLRVGGDGLVDGAGQLAGVADLAEAAL